jgi:hypothetical protein
MKNKIAFLSGVILYIGLAGVLSSYDNATMHRSINEAIVDKFLLLYPNDPDLEDYLFSKSEKVEGEGVTAAGWYEHSEGTLDLTLQEWIKHGGFSADEPELLQALRHFYDPKGNDNGKLYLTDIWPGLSLANPFVNSIEWALEHDGELLKGTDGANYLFQEHSWEDGKRSFMDAMQETDVDKQEKLMAHAWRCLGESMHGLADLACPVHVRNDGHPTGDADPYENAIKLSSYIPSNPSSYWDQGLIDRMKSKDSIRQVFHEMALFTNENFFTNQTVNGNGVEPIKPVIRPNKPYDLPFAQESGNGWEYRPEDFTFYRTIAGNPIKMCKDRYYFAGVVQTNYRTKDAYVDLDVAISQSQVLLSNLIGIGPNVIKRYIPEISIRLSDLEEESNIGGYVNIGTSVEYPVKKEFNSLVTIVNKSTGKSETVEANNDYFSTDELEYSEGDEIQAYISIGGMKVYSDIENVGGSFYKEFVTKSNDAFMHLGLRAVLFTDGTTEPVSIVSYYKNEETWSQEGTWDIVNYNLNGQILTINKERSWSEYGGETTGSRTHSIILEFSPDFSTILELRFNQIFAIDEFSYTRDVNASFVIENIPYEFYFGSPGNPGDFIRYWIRNDALQNSLKNFEYTNTYYNKNDDVTTTKTAESIDWSTSTYSEPDQCQLMFSKEE